MHHPPTCITTSSASLTLHLPPSQTQVRIKLASTQEALSVAQTQDVTTRRRVAELDSALKSSAERVDVLEQDMSKFECTLSSKSYIKIHKLQNMFLFGRFDSTSEFLQ